MRKNPRSLVLLLLVMALGLFGCSTQEPAPSPTPAPTTTPPPPKPVATGNPHCVDESGDCKITTEDIAKETGPQHECGPQFDDASAIHVSASGMTGSGKFKGIHVKSSDDKDFGLTITPCGTSPADPFTNKPSGKQKDWKSGKVKSGISAGSKYQMMLSKKAAGGKKMQFDPHIVIDN